MASWRDGTCRVVKEWNVVVGRKDEGGTAYLCAELLDLDGEFFALLSVLPFRCLLTFNNLYQMEMFLFEFFFLKNHFAEAGRTNEESLVGLGTARLYRMLITAILIDEEVNCRCRSVPRGRKNRSPRSVDRLQPAVAFLLCLRFQLVHARILFSIADLEDVLQKPERPAVNS